MGQMTIRVVCMAVYLVLVVLMETETRAQYYDQSYALVIGIDTYRYPKWRALTYAVKDAQGMAEFLKGQGFQVTPLYNQEATRNTIIYQMQNVLAPRVKEGDRVLIFFAGHGYTERLDDTDWGYIIPYDAAASSNTYISMEELQTLSRKMGQAKHQLFIMDACYGGLLGMTRSGAISENRPNYLDEITKRKTRQILTAGGPNQQVVDGGPGGHSVFTGYLLKGLQGEADLNGDGYVTVTELTSYLLPAATNTYQTPGYSILPGHEMGEFVFQLPRPMTKPITEAMGPNSIARRGPAENASTPVQTIRPDMPQEEQERLGYLQELEQMNEAEKSQAAEYLAQKAKRLHEEAMRIIEPIEDSDNSLYLKEMLFDLKKNQPNQRKIQEMKTKCWPGAHIPAPTSLGDFLSDNKFMAQRRAVLACMRGT